jgi:hypothetical protein
MCLQQHPSVFDSKQHTVTECVEMGWFDDNHPMGEAYDCGEGYMCGGAGWEEVDGEWQPRKVSKGPVWKPRKAPKVKIPGVTKKSRNSRKKAKQKEAAKAAFTRAGKTLPKKLTRGQRKKRNQHQQLATAAASAPLAPKYESLY